MSKDNEKTVAIAFAKVDDAFTEITKISYEMRRLIERLDAQKLLLWEAKKVLGMTKIRNEMGLNDQE